jgi:hypothetical protein
LGFHEFIGGTGNFEDVYRFSLGRTYDDLALAVTNDSTPPKKLNIGSGKLELFKETSADNNFTNDLFLGSFDFDSTSVSKIFVELCLALYYFKITGHVIGTNGGSYFPAQK